MGRTAKRRRKGRTDDAVTDAEKAAPLVTSLPFELIAEITLYSTSPADILSLSRTCKHFHATLVQNPVAFFIWKHVRAQTTPPVPDPTKLGFTEPQLANFIYGGGRCTQCGKWTDNMYTSFSARVRLCGDPECRVKYSRSLNRTNRIPPHATWLPWVEWVNTGEIPSAHQFVITDGGISRAGTPIYFVYVPRQLLQAQNEYNKAALLPATLHEYKQRKQKYVDSLEDWMNGCLELCRWKWEFTRMRRLITANNRTSVESFAVERKRDKATVLDAPTIVRLLREKLLDFKEVTRNDLEILWPETEEDLARIEIHRKNVEVELSRQRRRLEVERLYKQLDRSKFDCFPSLPQFRKLPTLRSFQDSNLDVKDTPWRNDFVDALVRNDIQEWTVKTVKAFSEHLGCTEWPPTKTLVHPVHWISSWFICTRCSKHGPRATRNKSLTFCEAARHACFISEKGNKDQWSPKNFVVDAKASSVVTKFMTAANIDMQEKTATDLVAIARDIMCLSCSAPIVMGFNAVIQHSHRHDDMQFMILSDEELVKFSDYPVTPGITARLTQTDKQTKEWRTGSHFACKHCIPNPLAAEGAEPSSKGKVSESQKKPKAFNFDGLSCHLKEKHNVVDVADEDFFVFNEYLKEWGYAE